MAARSCPAFAEKIIQEIGAVQDLSSVAYMRGEARRQGRFAGLERDRPSLHPAGEGSGLSQGTHQAGGRGLADRLRPSWNRNDAGAAGFKGARFSKCDDRAGAGKAGSDFPCPFAESEDPEAFELALKLAEEVDADIVIATDPDCDRVGAFVWDKEGRPRLLTGNQTGALLMDYILLTMQEQKMLPKNGAVIKTIVTSELGAEIAQHYGVDILNTLTGFKFIAEKMKEFEETGEKQFLFGYEKVTAIWQALLFGIRMR